MILTKKNFTIISVLLLVLVLLPRVIIVQTYKKKINPQAQSEVGIVFGASVSSDFVPSTMLQDRLETAISLYNNGQIKKILVSGDNRTMKYNEPITMAKYLETHGIPEEDIIIDYAGLRTYDTCKRAHDIFQINEAILITQEYHLYRALFLCNSLGVNSYGVVAQEKYGTVNIYNYLREIIATDYAISNIYIYEPKFIGGPIEDWRK